MFSGFKSDKSDKSDAKDLASLVDAINRTQATIEFNLDGTVLTANDNVLATLGYQLGEIKGQHGLYLSRRGATAHSSPGDLPPLSP